MHHLLHVLIRFILPWKKNTLPMITFTLPSSAITKKENFSNLFRVCLSDTYQAMALVELIKKIFWEKNWNFNSQGQIWRGLSCWNKGYLKKQKCSSSCSDHLWTKCWYKNWKNVGGKTKWSCCEPYYCKSKGFKYTLVWLINIFDENWHFFSLVIIFYFKKKLTDASVFSISYLN